MTPLVYVKLAAALLVVALLSGSALWLRSVVRERDRLKGELTEAAAANEASAATLRTVLAENQRGQAAVAKMSADLRTVSAREHSAQLRLAALERDDAPTRDWAREPLPAAVVRLLSDPDGGQAGGGAAEPAPGTAEAVRSADAGGAAGQR